MKFLVLSQRAEVPTTLDEPVTGVLRPVPWDDHRHQVLFHLSLRLANADVAPIGLVKLLKSGVERPGLANGFEQLGSEHCSMGQTSDFYDSLRTHTDDGGQKILAALRDLTVLPLHERETLWASSEVQCTLLRLSSARFAYTEELGERPSDIAFRVSHRVKGFARRHEVSFRFSRERMLGRVVVLVGENGTGKTQYLNGLVYPVLGISDPTDDVVDVTPPFSRLILLSFSAFDRFQIPRRVGGDAVIPYDYCGLRRYADVMRGTEVVDLPGALSELAGAYQELVRSGREEQWKACIGEFGLRPPAAEYFAEWVDERSAGQKFVCFILTTLLAKLERGALVLLDEPEMHTHPRMLSTIMRLLGELLEKFDAFAIVATHSPIVLQELPARQVRVIRAEGEPGRLVPRISEYPRECFAEGLDEILKSGFGLEITDMNYMKRLRELVRDNGVDAVEANFARGGLSAHLAIALADKLEDLGKMEDQDA